MEYKYICGSCGIESMSDSPFEVRVDDEMITRNLNSMKVYMGAMRTIDDGMEDCFVEIDGIISENDKNCSKIYSDMDEYNRSHLFKRHVAEESRQLCVYTFFGNKVLSVGLVEQFWDLNKNVKWLV